MKKFKSLLAMVLAFAMLFALAGCAEKPQAEREDDETEAKKTSSETNTPETNTPDYDVSDEDEEEDFEENTEENAEGNTEENIDTSGLPEIPGVDIAYEIEYFVESGFNTHTLKVGEGHTPLAAGWTQVGGKCYTTDESVVEVAKNGNVFARGVGTAYVVITGMSGMYDIYKYVVNG